MPALVIMFILLVFSYGGCATTTWPARVYHNPTLPLSNYRTFSFDIPVTANILEDKGREKIVKLLEKNGYRYVEDREAADFIVEESTQWEEKIGYTPPRVQYTPFYTHTSIIYIPSYVPERPYIYYDFYASLTFYDRASHEKIYEGDAGGTTSYLDLGEIYEDIIRQSNLPLSVGRVKVLTKEAYRVYATRRSKIYHRAGCPELEGEELIEFKSPEEAGEAGATACQRCRP